LKVEQSEKAAAAAARSREREQAAQTAAARAEGLRQRLQLITERLGQLKDRLSQTAGHLDRLAEHRDVLARTRDAARRELAQARSRDGFAVLPHKAANGTWRRPIPIECRDGRVTIQPGGPSLSLVELSSLGAFRSNPLAAAVGRYVAHAESGDSPDGAPVVPYVLFIIRPDGIRPYYEARGSLEPLGLSFGYELVEQDTPLEFPELSDPSEWTETPPLRFARGGWPPSAPGEVGEDPFVWPAQPAGRGGQPIGLDGGGEGRGGYADVAEGSLGLEEPSSVMGEATVEARSAGSSEGGTLLAGRGRRGTAGSLAAARPDQDPASPSSYAREGRGSSPLATLDRRGAGRPTGTVRSAMPSPTEARGAAGLDLAGTPDPGGTGSHGGEPVDGSTFRMERPMELVVACGPAGATIQPGGYRLSASNLEPGEARLVELLRGLVERREAREPRHVMLKPRLTFLVEQGGQATYEKARQQTILAGLGWPIRLRVAEGDVVRHELAGSLLP
jgi:hypothetical protein